MKAHIYAIGIVLLLSSIAGCTLIPSDNDKKNTTPATVTYTVTFETNGGSTITEVKAEKNTTISAPSAPTKTGFLFAGWYKETSLTTQWIFETDIVTADITLYAKWTDIVPPTDVSGLTATPENGTVTLTWTDPTDDDFSGVEITGSGSTIPVEKGTTVKNITGLINGTKYTFTVKSVDTTGNKSGGISKNATPNNISYTVTYDSNGGSTVTPQTVVGGNTTTEPTDPTLTGFTFGGWYKEKSPVTAWDFTSNDVTTDITLYAKWHSDKNVTSLSSTSSLVAAIDLVGVAGSNTVLQGRDVNLTSFYIGKYEITYAQWYEVYQWATVTAENKYTFANAGREGSSGTDGAAPTIGNTEPVTNLNWRDAILWCNALSEKEGLTAVYCTDSGFTTPLRTADNSSTITTDPGTEDNPYINRGAPGYRLPTEAEWEFAARYIDSVNWTPEDYLSGATANYTDNSASFAVGVFGSYSNATTTGVTGTASIGTKNANALGCYDMSGNVYEWCADWNSTLGTTSETDPFVSSAGSMRILRGGNYLTSTQVCIVSYRIKSAPNFPYEHTGFRIVR